LEVDEDLYSDREAELWNLEEGIYDSEEGRVLMIGAGFEEWRTLRGRTGLRPYEVEAGEIARWRLTLELNDIGRGMLAIDPFLTNQVAPDG
jgi:hypothetical protein